MKDKRPVVDERPGLEDLPTGDLVLSTLLAAARIVQGLPPDGRLEAAVGGYALAVLIIAGHGAEAVRLADTMLSAPPLERV